jgi:hypothetical protein
VKTGTPAAFISTEEGRDIPQSLIEYVANFVTIAAGQKLNAHVTIGVGYDHLPGQDAGGTVRILHVLARLGVGLPTWRFWHGPKGTQGPGADTLRLEMAGYRLSQGALR